MDTMLKAGQQELVIARDLNAARERVYAAWADPRKAVLWWAPQGCDLLSCEMDLRPGGAWLRRMLLSDGSVIVKRGVYHEVVPPARLVFTYTTDYADGATDPDTLVTLTFDELGPKRTRLTLRHTQFQTEESRVSHLGGWTTCIERFATYIDRTP